VEERADKTAELLEVQVLDALESGFSAGGVCRFRERVMAGLVRAGLLHLSGY
jgi:hypothetical protein